jgi:hypothetical protein
MIITKKALPRRALLRGMGATLALPLLDAMAPALSAAAAPVRRLGYVYMPMGAHIAEWTPPGADLRTLSPTLRSLAPVVDYVSVLSNMELRNAYPGTHATSNAAFLSAATAKWTESTDYQLATTADQVAAQQMGQGTRLPSLELAMDLLTTVGQCDTGMRACIRTTCRGRRRRHRCRRRRIRGLRLSGCLATGAARRTGRRSCARMRVCWIG